MKRTKFLSLIFIITLLTVGFSAVQAQKYKTWKITVSQSGGYAGIMKSYTLDNEGNLNRINKDQQNYEKIEDSRVRRIERLIRELKLPGTKLKKVGGLRIYDGVYSGFVITIDSKDYNIQGTSFNDAMYVALSDKQKETLKRLNQELAELNGFLSESTTNINN